MGDLELHLLMAAHWKADGGLMFGVVPKILWEKHKPADRTKLSEKRALQVALREPEGLHHALKRLGIRQDEVDAVITTHLHWDHAGGLTSKDESGGVSLTFPKAPHFRPAT